MNNLNHEDAGHDIYHSLRVEKCALELSLNSSEADPIVVSASALLHDLISYPKSDSRRSLSSLHSAERSSVLLRELGMDDGRIAKIHHCIHAHSFSAAIAPTTIEAKIVQDADRMEALGAIGIARCFYTSGLLKRELFHPMDPEAKQRPLDDLQYALDHFYVKLLKLPEMMQTSAGRTRAHELAERLKIFAQQLIEEVRIN